MTAGIEFFGNLLKARQEWSLHSGNKGSPVTENKKTVERYMDGFIKSDHQRILSCLTEDVEWKMPGAFHLVGKDAFDQEIENDAFVGSPAMTITRMVEENDVVIGGGAVRVKRKDGGFLNAVFCDVFAMKNAKIRRVTSYLVELK
jgi:ketosteroid isomerase-like protein